jgi:trans-aconitate methyltransferase
MFLYGYRRWVSISDRIFGAVKEVFPEVKKYLEEKHPELVQLYQQRYNYAMDEHYPFMMRLHNAYEILRVYMVIRRERK